MGNPPVQCPRCKSPYWDVPRKYDRLVKQVVKTAPVGADRVDFYHNGVHDGSVRIPAKPEDIPGVTRGFPQPVEEDVPEPEMCAYTEWSGELGEDVRCGLVVHGPKVKHGNWKKL